MKAITLLTLLMFTLAGCATTMKETTLSDGTKGLLAKCGGTKHDWGDCYDIAMKACSNGFDPLDKEEIAHGVYITRNLMFKCK